MKFYFFLFMEKKCCSKDAVLVPFASFNHKIGKLAKHNFSGEQENKFLDFSNVSLTKSKGLFKIVNFE